MTKRSIQVKFFMLAFMVFSVSCKPTQSLELEPHKNKSGLYTESENSRCDDALESDFSIGCIEQAQLAGVIPAYRFDEIYSATNTGSCFIGTVTVEEVASIKNSGFCMGAGYSSAMPAGETILESAPSGAAMPAPALAPAPVPAPAPAALPTSSGECGYTNKCWGFFSFKWFNTGESSNGYTCKCGIWLPGA